MLQSLAYFAMLLNREFIAYSNQRLAEIGLSQGQLYFILYVGKHPECAPKQLAEALQMDAGHVTRSLVKLEQSGFLLQEQSDQDRRLHRLRLTEQGEAAFRLIYALFPQWDEKRMAALSQGEQDQLLGLLGKLIQAKGA